MSGLIEAELAATCSSLGGIHGGKYVVEPQCYESVRDIIRYLRRDDEYHAVRKYLGEANILQTDLVHIAAVSSGDLFDIVIRLMVNLTNPALLLYKEELPAEKVGRNIYMSLIAYSQEYKAAFCSVVFWKVVCAKLTELFEVDWAERSEDQSLQIERLLVLLRNVLQVPADAEAERRPDNDVTVHDKVLWALRESQLLELLLYVSSNKDEEQYYLHLLEVFSLILREQSPGLLATCEIRRSVLEKERDAKELLVLREKEKLNNRSFKNTRNFRSTFVVKNVKSISDKEVVYHKSLDKLSDLKLTQDKKRRKTPKNKCPVDSERPERRSTFSVRLFLKEFCLELLSCSFNNLMGVVKDKLVSGGGLANDESYYFWALKFFLEFTCSANIDVKLVSECINVQTFHFAQTQMENCYDHLKTDKKKISTWVKRLHLILKAYRSALQTLQWMDSSKDPKIRESSRQLKSSIFYVVEYRELLLSCLLKYDPAKFPLSFLRDLIETNHLGLKLLEGYCKGNKIVVQRKKRVVKRSKPREAPKETPAVVTPEEKWDRIKDEIFNALSNNTEFPEIPPFDAASSVPIDEQKEEAMKNVQRYLRKGEVKDAVGLLRSARQVWPENDDFGNDAMAVEDEVMALQEICVTDLGVVEIEDQLVSEPEEDRDTDEEEEEQDRVQIVEQGFDLKDYIKKLVNRKVVEGCCILLANYKKNSANTNHCVAKLLHRIAFECKAPSMLYQASFFMTLQKILRERDPEYSELQQFAKYLIKNFRANAQSNPKIYMELLFWKDVRVAFDIENGYGTSEQKENRGVWLEEEEDELRRLWVEFDQKMLDGDKVDWIRDNLINQSRSRVSIIKKLKELMLIAPGAKIAKKRRGGKEWTEAEMAQLAELFQQFKDAIDVAERIKERLPFTATKKRIKDKLVEMGLVSCLADLRKKKSGRSGRGLGDVDDVQDNESSDESNESSSESENDQEDERAGRFVVREVVEALRKVEEMKGALEWLKETYEECLEDDDASDGYPLLALDSQHSEALENSDFQDLLRKLGIHEPLGEQMYWKIKMNSKLELHERLELINSAIAKTLDDLPALQTQGRESEDSDSEDDFEKLRRLIPSAISRDLHSKNTDSSSFVEQNLDIADASGGENSEDVQEKSRSRRIPSESDDSEDEFDKLKRLVPSAIATDSKSKRGRSLQNGSKVSMDEEVSKDVPKPEKSRIRRAALESDDSDDEPTPSEPVESLSHPIDSDRSDKGGSSDQENRQVLSNGSRSRRPACLASDSDGENSPPANLWRQKRRRCIGSDSEVEERPSDDEGSGRPLEVRKKSKMFDSDSEGGGSGISGS